MRLPRGKFARGKNARGHGVRGGPVRGVDSLVQKYLRILDAGPEIVLPMEGTRLTRWDGTPIYYADPAGTTPVHDVGDPVGGHLDLVSGEIKATQTTDAYRPVLTETRLSFDGTSDRLIGTGTLANADGSWTTGPHSVVGIGTPVDEDTRRTMVGTRDSGGWVMEVRGTLGAHDYNLAYPGVAGEVAGAPVSPDRIALGYSWSSATAPRVYVDGSLVDTGTDDPAESNSPIVIGNHPNTSRFWHGTMQAVALWRRVLSASEMESIAALMRD